MTPKRTYLACCALLALLACGRSPDPYAPPVQRKPITNTGAGGLGPFVRMNDPQAESYILEDISRSLEGNLWRWTGRRPKLRFYLDATQNLKLRVEFAVAGNTFKETGPVTVSVYINGRFLDKIRCDAPGEQHFEKAVPADLLTPKALNNVTIDPDKVWVSKDDGAVLGLILTSAGFVQ